MSCLPNEIFADLTKFLPNDDITDLMLLSRKFNALVTPRLKKINQDLTTMNQSIKSPVPEISDDKWIAQLNLKKFEPIGSTAKKREKDVFEILSNGELDVLVLMALKEKCGWSDSMTQLSFAFCWPLLLHQNSVKSTISRKIWQEESNTFVPCF